MTRKSASWLVIVTAVIGAALWILIRVLTYVAADQTTASRISVGMSGREVQQLFGRAPFQDSDVTLRGFPEVRKLLLGDTKTRFWDGPEGLITVVFDKDGWVQKVSFFPADQPVSLDKWFRARLGWWPPK